MSSLTLFFSKNHSKYASNNKHATKHTQNSSKKKIICIHNYILKISHTHDMTYTYEMQIKMQLKIACTHFNALHYIWLHKIFFLTTRGLFFIICTYFMLSIIMHFFFHHHHFTTKIMHNANVRKK